MGDEHTIHIHIKTPSLKAILKRFANSGGCKGLCVSIVFAGTLLISIATVPPTTIEVVVEEETAFYVPTWKLVWDRQTLEAHQLYSEVYSLEGCTVSVFRDGSGVFVEASEAGISNREFGTLTHVVEIILVYGDVHPHDRCTFKIRGRLPFRVSCEIIGEEFLQELKELPLHVQDLFFGWKGVGLDPWDQYIMKGLVRVNFGGMTNPSL